MQQHSRHEGSEAPAIVGRLGTHPSRPHRWALISEQGVVTNWLDLATKPRDEVVAELAPALERAGLVLRDDNTLIRAADSIAPHNASSLDQWVQA